MRSGRCAAGLELDANKFAEARDVCNARARKAFRKLRGIIDEVCLAEAHFDNGAAGQRRTQSAHYGFDFGKFRHDGISFKIAQSGARIIEGHRQERNL